MCHTEPSSHVADGAGEGMRVGDEGEIVVARHARVALLEPPDNLANFEYFSERTVTDTRHELVEIT